MNFPISIIEAQEWANTEDKYVYCLDLIGLSANHPKADEIVEEMEGQLELLWNQECDEPQKQGSGICSEISHGWE